jgi:signal transduction histidine kinase
LFRSLTARKDLSKALAGMDVVYAIDTVRAVGLIVVLVTVSLARPHPLAPGIRGTAVAVVLGLTVVAWTAWMLGGRRRGLLVAGLTGMGAAGGTLTGLSPNSAAVAIGCMASFSAAVHLRPDVSLGITAETLAAFLVTGLVAGASTGSLVGYSFAFAGLWSMGLTRHNFLERAEQAEHMLAESRRAREAETQAAALAERARIARDIHDVLAHSLAAVSVNLQAAEGLLSAAALPADNPELVKAIGCIGRAGTLTREGLAAARRAVMALREDAAPLREQLSSLVSQYDAAGDTAVDFRVTGAVRPLSEQVSLTAYRTAQEALTNARKHAPGQPVTLSLGFEAAGITVSVVNPLPPAGAEGPLAAAGAGYGLTGLTERAALLGGTLDAGPAAGSWRVALRIPA